MSPALRAPSLASAGGLAARTRRAPRRPPPTASSAGGGPRPAARRMAQDGCQTPAWHGSAFPYLRHQPAAAPASYAAGATAPTAVRSDNTAGGNVGTWNGPRPRGQAGCAGAAPGAAAAEASMARGPEVVPLPGGGKMPMIGFGTFGVASADAVRHALEIGYRHIDCAFVYGNQDKVGEGLRDFVSAGRRAELFVVSKVWNDQHRPADVRKSAQTTLKDLGCEYVDLMLVHWPDAWRPGTQEPDTSVTHLETWRAMEALVDDGLARAVGISNFSVAEAEALLAHARIPPAVNQCELHPLLAQRRLVGTCLRRGINMVAYSPLGRGGGELLKNKEIAAVAQETGRTLAQVCLRWNVQRGVTVIPKANSPKHQKENLEGLFDWALTTEQKARIDALDEGKRFIDPSWHEWADTVDTPSKQLL